MKKRTKSQKNSIFDSLKNDANEYSFLLFLKNGGDPNMVDEDGNSLLHLAVMHNRTTSALRLIDLGADVHYLNKHKYNALHIACGDDHREILVERFIQEGVDINSQTENGHTALMLSGSNIAYVTMLLERGADLELKNAMNETAVDMIQEYHDTPAKELIEAAYEELKLNQHIKNKPESFGGISF